MNKSIELAQVAHELMAVWHDPAKRLAVAGTLARLSAEILAAEPVEASATVAQLRKVAQEVRETDRPLFWNSFIFDNAADTLEQTEQQRNGYRSTVQELQERLEIAEERVKQSERCIDKRDRQLGVSVKMGVALEQVNASLTQANLILLGRVEAEEKRVENLQEEFVAAMETLNDAEKDRRQYRTRIAELESQLAAKPLKSLTDEVAGVDWEKLYRTAFNAYWKGFGARWETCHPDNKVSIRQAVDAAIAAHEAARPRDQWGVISFDRDAVYLFCSKEEASLWRNKFGGEIVPLWKGHPKAQFSTEDTADDDPSTRTTSPEERNRPA